MTHDPQSYWDDLHRRDDLSSVGQSGYSADWNAWLYRAWLRTGLTFLERHQVAARTVCDVGAGKGSWFPVWRSIGAKHITATDLSAGAVRGLDADAAHQLDVSDVVDLTALGTFDLVAAMYVLLHITDDVRFRQAMRNLATLVAPGGHLLLAEPILLRRTSRPARPGADSRARPLTQYALPDLTLLAVEAATVIAGDPLESEGWRGHLARARWGVTARVGSRLPGMIGPIIARLDPWLTTHSASMPGAKLALFRRGD